jgi:hypothetical protein
MIRHARTLVASLPLAILAFLASCASDEIVRYDGPGSVTTILPEPGLEEYSPTISADGGTIAWVRGFPDSVLTRQILWMRGRRFRPDTVWTVRDTAEIEIDLSPDGDRIVVLEGAGGSRERLFHIDGLSSSQAVEGGTANLSLYSSVRTARWADEATILFGANGPGGSGVHSWHLAGDSIAPVATTFNWYEGRWTGAYPGIDRTGSRVCMERISDPSNPFTRQAIVVDRATGAVMLSISGGSPSFWTLTSDEPDAILYIDGQNRLWAGRPGIGAVYLAGYAESYDVSEDGEWIFTRAFSDDMSALVLYSIKELR